MRSLLARIIVIAAVITLVPSVLDFLEMTRGDFHFSELSIEGGALVMLGRAALAPIGLFAAAAIVEMLFRISEALPRAPQAAPARSLRQVWPWRNSLANLLLVVALLAYLISFWAMTQYWLHGDPSVMDPQRDLASITKIGMFHYWLVAPVDIIAWAAVIEYLSRIAAAHRAAPRAE